MSHISAFSRHFGLPTAALFALFLLAACGDHGDAERRRAKITSTSEPAGEASTVLTRVALVIGNEKYEQVARLKNPKADAKLVSAALAQAGFSVRTETDLPFSKFAKVLREFRAASEDADIALVYFAGHGMEAGRINWLLPVDASFDVESDLNQQAIPADDLINYLSRVRGLKVLVLDACRNNPFAISTAGDSGQSRSVSVGLAAPNPPSQMLILYSAKAGTTADDGLLENSPFAISFANRISEHADVRQVFGGIRDDVVKFTQRQEPYTYGTLGRAAVFLTSRPPQSSHAAVAPEDGRPEFVSGPNHEEMEFSPLELQTIALARSRTILNQSRYSLGGLDEEYRAFSRGVRQAELDSAEASTIARIAAKRAFTIAEVGSTQSSPKYILFPYGIGGAPTLYLGEIGKAQVRTGAPAHTIRHGLGVLTNDFGDTYAGEFFWDLPIGYGVWSVGRTLEVRSSAYSALGAVTFPNQDTYLGPDIAVTSASFVNGNAVGAVTSHDGTRYEGGVDADGRWNGKGILWVPNGRLQAKGFFQHGRYLGVNAP